MRRLAVLACLLLAACTSTSAGDGGVDLGAAFCLGGGFPTCTSRDEVPVCDATHCVTCTSDGRVVCGTPSALFVPDLGPRTRCLADPSSAPPATCASVCMLDPTACGDAGAD